ncbi:MAG: alkene reductase, partial [Rhizobiaceae bacterium]|nr:alkene reductase [Rhizobiaceae bacterium]
YLIDQFLRADVNDRTDQYGGSIENRARFLFEVVDTVTKEVGTGRTAIRISPVTPSGDSSDPHPQALFTYVVEGLAKYDLAYVHIVEGQTGGARDFLSFDYDALHAAYKAAGGKSAWMLNNGYTRDMAIDAVESGKADVIAFGKLFISNPDLVHRLKENAPLAAFNAATLYGGGETGYADYPTLDEAA